MIEFFRNHVQKSILLKIFLGVLMASFGVWRVGDFMTGGQLNPGTAIKVGQTEVKATDLQRQYGRDLDRFRQAMNGQSIPEEIMKRTVMDTTVRELTQSATLDEAANTVGLHITPDELRTAVYESQAFQENGKFNRMRFEQILSNNNITESAFLKLFESDMRRALLLQPVVVNAGAPQYLVNSLYEYRNETRIADTLLIPDSAMSLETVPKDEDLKAVYDKNIAAFTSPEYRKLTVLTLTGGDLVKPSNIDDEQAKAYYDENQARYRAPATKRISQIIFDSKEKAEAARAKAAPDDSLEALAAKAKSAPPVDLGQLAEDSPLAKMIGKDAYNTPLHQISQPVQTPLGWHLLEIKSETPEATQPFEAVKESIRNTIAADKGADAVYDASVQVEDAMASGTPLAEIAKSVGGQITQFAAIDQEGKDPNGLIVPNRIDTKDLVKNAFETPTGKESRLLDLPNREGYYVIHVDEVTPPTPKPLLEVRAKVAAIWEKEEKAKLAQALADKLAKDIGPSTKFSNLDAQDKRVSYAPLGPITRFGEGLDRKNVVDAKRLSPDVLEHLFKAKTGDVFVAPVQDGMLIAQLKEVVPAGTPSVENGVQRQLAESLRNDIGSNLTDQVAKAFADRFPTELDRQTIDRMIATR